MNTKEQRGVMLDVWQTGLTNPDFAELARSCGGFGVEVTEKGQLDAAFREALAYEGPVAGLGDHRSSVGVVFARRGTMDFRIRHGEFPGGKL